MLYEDFMIHFTFCVKSILEYAEIAVTSWNFRIDDIEDHSFILDLHRNSP